MKRFFLLIILPIFLLTGCADPALNPPKMPKVNGKIFEDNEKAQAFDKAIGKALSDLQTQMTEVLAIAKEVSKNPRAVELEKKGKSRALSAKEKQELQDMMSVQMLKYYIPKLKNKNIDDFDILTFDDSRCKKCHSVIPIYKEISSELGIGIIIINPSEFQIYAEEHNLLPQNMSARMLSDLYSDSNRLAESMGNSDVPVFLYDKKLNEIHDVGNIGNGKNKNSSKATVAMMLNMFAKPQNVGK
jgi:hypothetical protein